MSRRFTAISPQQESFLKSRKRKKNGYSGGFLLKNSEQAILRIDPVINIPSPDTGEHLSSNPASSLCLYFFLPLPIEEEKEETMNTFPEKCRRDANETTMVLPVRYHPTPYHLVRAKWPVNQWLDCKEWTW
jgi:hypothetical protein